MTEPEPTTASTTTTLTTTTNPTMTAPTKALPFSLTLILAATPSLGIGKAGTLPWPQLKKEMGYFARVTKRVPPRPSGASTENVKRLNAVVMGRKTWESIPEKFRPLKGRVNVVITRNAQAFNCAKTDGEEGPIVVGSIVEALHQLHELPRSGEQSTQIERVFVIGGASIYKAALEMAQTDRILLTKIEKEYECDTFFPVDLDERGNGWGKVDRRVLEEYTGENVGEEGVEEAGVRFEFCLYEREKRGH